jgi:trigger factor
MQRLRDRGARHEPVEGRGVDHGDTLTVDLERSDAGGTPDTHKDVSIELGAKANPPGFDEQLLGLEAGATKSFTLHYPGDYPIGELANTDVSYTVTVIRKSIRDRPASTGTRSAKASARSRARRSRRRWSSTR